MIEAGPYFFSRVDPDYNNTAQTLSNLRSLVASANCKTYNFSAGGNKLILDYQPIMRPGSGNSDPWQMLPARLQWYDTSDINDATSPHKWRGGTLGFTLPNDGSPLPDKMLTIVSRIEVAFRGRKCTYDPTSSATSDALGEPMVQEEKPAVTSLMTTANPTIKPVAPTEGELSGATGILSRLCI